MAAFSPEKLRARLGAAPLREVEVLCPKFDPDAPFRVRELTGAQMIEVDADTAAHGSSDMASMVAIVRQCVVDEKGDTFLDWDEAAELIMKSGNKLGPLQDAVIALVIGEGGKNGPLDESSPQKPGN